MKVYAVIRVDSIDYSEETTAVFANEDDAFKDVAEKDSGADSFVLEYRVQPWDVQGAVSPLSEYIEGNSR